jgi:hypothetical protein
MGGGLMQLVAYGAQDIYLTGNPQITFFKVVYRRHTNFSMEAIEQTLNGTVNFGSRVTATVSRNGDLVSRMYIQTDLTSGDDLGANAGHALVSNVELEIGGQKIDKHTGLWMETWSELTLENKTFHTGAAATTRVAGTVFQNMACAGGLSGAAIASTDTMYVPLQFWFCRNPGLALPLIALQYHEVKVILELAAETQIFSAANTNTINNFKLWADYIYLDTDERRRFAQVSHEYLIEQVQEQTFATDSTSCELNFNHPVKELIWVHGGVAAATTAVSHVTPETFSSISATAIVKLNGHDRFTARPMTYFTRCQVNDYHTGCGGIIQKDAIAVYSFALKPEEHQPSGTCNFSRIDNAKLEFSASVNADQSLIVYAVNYNVLRIMSGMGGLAYSN